MIARRSFITLLGGAAAAWPLAAGAQSTKLPVIGFLGVSTPAAQGHMVAALVQRLRELGWIEGRTIAIDYRWAEGRDERYSEIAGEFVRLKVDAILTQGTQAAMAAKQATSAIPIVATVIGDPVGSGLVTSLALPGGNVTGLSVVSYDLAAKRLELLLEAVPGVRRVGILVDVGNPVNVEEARQVQAAADKLGLEGFPIAIRLAEDIVPAFDGLKNRADALLVVANPLILSNIVRINILAAGARLPTSYIAREYVQAGGLLAYGPTGLFTDAPAISSIRFCAGQSPALSRWSSRPSLILSSTSPPRKRSVSTCPQRCSPAPTR
jgi:putative tryptophan/tyrosine transport system substrate-binding protein